MLVGAAAAVVALLYLPTALLEDGYPAPAPYTSCNSDCPENAFFLFSSEPGVVDGFFVPVRDLLTLLIFLAVTVRIWQRVTTASPLMRRILTPVLFVAGGRILLMAIGVGARWVNPDSELTEALVLIVALALPAIAAGFFVGMFQRRLYAADALQKLAAHVTGRSAAPARYGPPLPGAAGPLASDRPRRHRNPHRWIDSDGHFVDPPGPDSGRHLSEIRAGDRIVAGIVHDSALCNQPTSSKRSARTR